ncbi:MAG: TIR domain-containing protein [Clostridia bacterium]|nr:TIR domain-containing protein [Clostridia bacterium]
MTRDEVLKFLESLPDERIRQYELGATKFVMANGSCELENQLLEIMDSLIPGNICYNAFFCLNIYYRHVKDYQKLQDLITTNAMRFELHITFDHLKALFELESDGFYSYHDVLLATYKDSIHFDDNAGFIHLFADVFATVCEKAGLSSDDPLVAEWYDRALNAVNRAIELDPSYAKYYCTKARILSIKHNYPQALESINRAISYENSSRADYALRYSTYLYHKAMIVSATKYHGLEEALKELQALIPKTGVEETSSSSELVPYCGTEPYLFVSYAHDDKEKVFDLLQKLSDRGLRLWFDKKGIPSAVEFTEYIAQRIIDCSKVLFFVSPTSVNRDYVRMEISHAISKGKTPICVFLEETTLSAGMSMQLNRFQHVFKYTMNDVDTISEIMSGLNDEIQAKV